MTTIVTRSGKGSPLTHTEVDTNFTNLNTAKLETAAIPLGTLGAPSISFLSYSTTGIYSPAGDELGVSMLGSDKIRIKSTGEIIINATASRTTLGVTPRLQIEGNASSSQCSVSLTGAGAGGTLFPRLYLNKARSSVNAIVLEDDILGFISFNGGDGSSLVNAGFIKAEVDGTPSAGIVPGRLVFATVDTAGGSGERMIIKNNGNVSIDGTTFNVDAVNNRVGIGTSSPSQSLQVVGAIASTGQAPALTSSSTFFDYITALNTARFAAVGNTTGTAAPIYFSQYSSNGSVGRDAVVIDSTGRVGIGTTSVDAAAKAAISNGGAEGLEFRAGNTAGVCEILTYNRSSSAYTDFRYDAATHQWKIGGVDKAKLDSSGRLLVGTSTGPSDSTLVLQGNSSNATFNSVLRMLRDVTNPAADTTLGTIVYGVGSAASAVIEGYADAQWAANDYPGRLVFSTTADGASSPTERMRITSDGSISTKTSPTSLSAVGTTIFGASSVAPNAVNITRSSGYVLAINRTTDDGNLVEFYQDTTIEGTISVSGTTVSYNGAHLSRWSQLPSDAERTEIFRGTLLSNIDEMCEWGEEDNEQLNRMKVSDVEGDKNVSGVFQAWDDDDDTYINDFYCAMTGDFIIRIAEGVTVERGDLLMSAGDGTAKPQDDDIIRSKTIAKVTSTNVSCTYEDGSYCVPCVLMAC